MLIISLTFPVSMFGLHGFVYDLLSGIQHTTKPSMLNRRLRWTRHKGEHCLQMCARSIHLTPDVLLCKVFSCNNVQSHQPASSQQLRTNMVICPLWTFVHMAIWPLFVCLFSFLFVCFFISLTQTYMDSYFVFKPAMKDNLCFCSYYSKMKTATKPPTQQLCPRSVGRLKMSDVGWNVNHCHQTQVKSCTVCRGWKCVPIGCESRTCMSVYYVENLQYDADTV